MDLLRELKAMPVTLHLLQVGPTCPLPVRASGAPAGPPAPRPRPWAAQTPPLTRLPRGLPGQLTLSLATEAPKSQRGQ